jgi:flavodoxin
MKVLVAYFSRTGHTETVAREISARTNADLAAIRDAETKRTGLGGYVRSGWQAFRGTKPPILPDTHTPADYDLVVIGTPIWNWRPSAPVRTYITQHVREFSRVAFFCTEGGSGDHRVFAEMQALCGCAPAATLAVKESEIKRCGYEAALDSFVRRLDATTSER